MDREKYKEIDGKYWIYNTIEAWHKQFPFWSISTIKRIISNLEKEKLIITGNFNKISIDRTKWYTNKLFITSGNRE